MKCSQCQFENPEGAKFCGKCRTRLVVVCPQCDSRNPPENEFCNECGHRIREDVELKKPVPEGERKHVTVLFSDLSGYTAMSEKLDPEEVKEITSRIFGQISQVVAKYEGFIEKFVGDAVMALFGVPKAHEDDPVRAIRAAREIHDLVEATSPELEERIGQPLSMHTGINTGLVVTGKVDLEKGTHGVAGDTINLSSRLSRLAKAGEIVAGPETYRQAEGYFIFEALEPTTVKGKQEPIQIHKVLTPKERPVTIHRLSGLRADLIGRKAEIAQLGEAVQNLREGKGRIFSICGDAGTGKSRLIEEFKATLDLKEIQWREGHAYPHSQNIPYFPLIDLLSRAFEIEEGDPPEKVRQKVESGIEHLVGTNEDLVPYVGSLYSLSYPEIEDVSPEFWKSRLQDATQKIIAALAQRSPTIFFLEDLHWADPSFVELLRHTLLQVRQPAIVLCVYRPTFSLFTSDQLTGIGKIYQEIRLQDLSLSEAQDMLESLLKTETIPSDLKRFVQDKAEGNPFYLEELVNSLIESETLIRDNGSWKVTRSITESDISSTIHGLISGRLDRLEKETKRIIQEASVIGRAFLYEILKRITELKDRIDRGLSTLERLDLIRTRSLQPDLEYMFKHALTQEVVYNGLLKKERQEIHERIACVMEELFHERLSEFSESLAFHFKQGQSVLKAVDYLMKSGEKSLKRYSVEESHRYYEEAFDLLTNKPEKSIEEKALLIDLLIKWALVFYYRGDFKTLTRIFEAHEDLAESLEDKARLGMFYAWLGFSLYNHGIRYGDSYRYLCNAVKMGEEADNQQVIGYACAWLAWVCSDLGLFEEGIIFGEKAQKVSNILKSDQYLHFKSLGGMGYAYWHMGETKKALELGERILNYGQRYSNIRSIVMGHFVIIYSYLLSGDIPLVIEYAKKAVQIAKDPFYVHGAKILLGQAYLFDNQFDDAEVLCHESVSFCEESGLGWLGTIGQISFGAVSIAKGHMGKGLRMLKEAQQMFLDNQRKTFYGLSEYILGKVYLQIVQREKKTDLSTMVKNIGFLVKTIPFASKKAEDHLSRAIEISKEIGAKGVLGQAYLDLGLLHKAKGKKDKARPCIYEAVNLFEQCEAEVYLKHAKEALDKLG